MEPEYEDRGRFVLKEHAANSAKPLAGLFQGLFQWRRLTHPVA